MIPQTNALLLSLILWAEWTGAHAAPPPKEIEWLPVRNLVADVTRVELDLVPDDADKVSAGPRAVICVRGVFPVVEQKKSVADMIRRVAQHPADPSPDPFGLPKPRSPLPLGKRYKLRTTDFVLERQVLERANAAAQPWKPVDMEKAVQITRAARDFVPDVVGAAQIDPVCTMPLLTRRDGQWGVEAGHPLLKDANKESLLFRYLDFDVEPGKFYRYRVKLTVVNPLFGAETEDPFLSQGTTRETPWSQPSSGVRVPSM